VQVWAASTGQLLRTIEEYSRGREVIDRAWRVQVWRLASGELLQAYRGHRWDPFDNGVLSLTFSPDGRTLVSGGEDGRVVLWDVPEE
jgi:WD40 repeat protein